MRIRSPENFWAGVMFIGFGALAVVVARNYPIGSTMRMGPGYFPIAVGLCLVALGAVIAITGLKAEGERILPFAWKPMVLVSVAFAFFAWGIEHIGFIPALAILVVLSALAGREYRWREVLVEAVVLIAGCWAIFIYGIGLPFPLIGGR